MARHHIGSAAPETSERQVKAAGPFVVRYAGERNWGSKAVEYRMVSGTDRKLSAALCMALLTISACRPEESRIQLLEIPVSDLERAVGFYQAVFEWGVSRPDSFYAVLEARPVAIGLAQRDSVIAGGSNIVVGVTDLEMILARVVENGGAVSTPVGPSWRGRQFIFADPDGNGIVVWSEGGDASAGGG